MHAASAPYWRLSPTSVAFNRLKLVVAHCSAYGGPHKFTWSYCSRTQHPAPRLCNDHCCRQSSMVQGKTKGLQSKASTSRHAAKSAANTKKGKRTIAPKKPILIKQAALHKVHRVSCSYQTNLSDHFYPKTGFNGQNQQVYWAPDGICRIFRQVDYYEKFNTPRVRLPYIF